MRTIRRSFSSILNLLFLFSVISFTSCESEKENITYRIDVISGEGGTATSSHKEIMEGWEVKLTAIAEDNYRFVNWTVNGKEVSTSNPYTATITAHTQFKANFEKDNYKVIIKAGKGGTAKASPEGEILKGTKVTFTAIPQEGYGFANWTVNGKVVSTSNPYIATITKDIEIHANFITHKVVVIAGEGGTAKTSNTIVGHNEETTLTAIPNESYQFLNWTINGKEVSKNRTFTTRITANTEFVANFVKITTKINGEGVVKTVSNTNGTITLSATPNDSYQFLNWTVNGKEVSKNRTFTTRIAANTEFVANFVKVTVKVNGEGVAKLVINTDGTITLTATPNKSYDFVNWSVNGEEISKNNPYTATIINDIEFTANFITYKIKVIESIGGTAKVNKNNAASNEEVILTATPQDGYRFVNWTINGEVVSNSNPYTYIITEDINAKANFTERAYSNEHEYIDLGLSVKWATCNVGATTPEKYGDYFAWGETYLKENFYWDTYSYCNGSEDSQTKYCTDSKYGIVDNKKILELSDDAANVNWGGRWRMPTRNEFRELIDNCTWEWTTQNGTNGLKMTSKKNGNSIFLPAAGCSFATNIWGSISYVNHHKEGIIGYYWTSTFNVGYKAHCLSIDNSGDSLSQQERYSGFTIRAVHP